MASSDWSSLRNEAAVELRVILPLLSDLGYELEDIAPKYPVEFQEGRRGRKKEADFVLFSGPLHDRNTSLVVIEAKGPGEDADEDARRQAESYSFATRAPIVAICSSEQLQVWQVNSTFESQCVLRVELSELASRRGDLDRFLQKDAVVEYCRNVALKPLAEATVDFGAYETAELRRTLDVADQLDRKLSGPDLSPSEVTSDQLISVCPSGAVITAASGYGKSILSLMLLRRALSERWRDSTAPLAVHVPITDVRPKNSLLEHVRDRIAAFKPGFTLSQLQDLLRNDGMIFLCDGFDRLTAAAQADRAAEFRTLIRDYPKLRLFVFSRPSVRPELPIRQLQINPLDDSEIYKIIALRLPDDELIVSSSMTSMLRNLCRNPLLLSLTIAHWRLRRAFPNRIEELFAAWLERTLALAPQQAVKRALAEVALEILADHSGTGRIAWTAATKALREADLSVDILDDLVACDALVPDGAGMVRLEHDALSDYLRARRLCGLGPDKLAARLPGLDLQAGSFFPVLVMALLRDAELHEVMWRRLAGLNFELYLEVLRYRADLSSAHPTDADGERFISEMLDGLELPLDGFFPRMRAAVEQLFTGENNGLALHGTAGPGSVVYGFRPRRSGERIRIGSPERPGGHGFVNLGPSGLRLDSGRLLGLQMLRDKLRDAIDQRLLHGREMWRQERLVGWCAALSHEYRLPLDETSSLAAWESWALPLQGRVARGGGRRAIPIDAFLSDIRLAQAGGLSHLQRGVRPCGWRFSEGDALVRAVEDHFAKTQLVYRELVEENFLAVGHLMGSYFHLPVRWKLYLHDRNERGPMASYRWHPVRDWDEAGADVALGEGPEWDFDSHYSEVSRELEILGRARKYNRVTLGGVVIRSLEERSESSVVTSATAQVMDDLKELFSEMPSGDAAPNWD